MALLFRPHTVTVWAGTESIDAGGTVLPVDFATAGVDVLCSVQPVSARTAYEMYGVTLTQAAYELLVNPEDGAALPVGARVLWALTGQYLRVRGFLPWLNTGLSHYEILAEVEASA